MQWILDNMDWIFSGIGVSVLSLIAAFFIKNRSSTKQSQKSGDNSTNYQSTGDINIGNRND